jgi:C-terminal processing protease CtpA/Prc
MSDKPRAMRFDRGFQQSIIQLMLKDHQFCHRACSLLEPGHFADRLSWFFTTISEWYEDHGQIITKEGIAADILKQPTDKQQGYYDDLN